MNAPHNNKNDPFMSVFQPIRGLGLLLLALLVQPVRADLPVVKVASLQFGTLNWELDVMHEHGLDKKHGFELVVTPLSAKNASSVALQSGAVDLIYSDWVWVNRQRHDQRLYGFSPVSAAVGALYVQADSNIHALADLKGQRLGIAGGPVDKSWLLLRAYSQKVSGQDLATAVEPVFGAPPLLNKLMLDNKLPAALNFWHYGARLQASGFRSLISVQEVLQGLGITTPVPLLGWVFPETWAHNNPDLLNRFLLASAEARQLLLDSDAEWQRIKPLTQSENDAIFIALRDEYRRGLFSGFNADTLKALHGLYDLFAREGGKELTGGADTLDDGLFVLPSATGLIRPAP
jgi:NitT/TauT family transport system substrate-binding protein